MLVCQGSWCHSLELFQNCNTCMFTHKHVAGCQWFSWVSTILMIYGIPNNHSWHWWVIRFNLQLNGRFRWELVAYDLPLVVLNTKSIIFPTCGACSEVKFEFDWRAIYSGSLRVKLILASSAANVECSFVQTSTHPSSTQCEDLPNMGGVACQTTNSKPKDLLN